MNPRGLWPGLRSFGRVLARLGVAMLSALLLGAHASWAWLFPLTYVALVPWVVLYTRNDHPRVSAGYYVVSVWVAWLLCHLLVFRFGWLAAIATTTILFVFWTPFALILRGIHHRFHFPRAVTVPIVWVGLEWVRAQFTLGHLDFFGLGYSQAFLTPLIQFADVTGVYGVSFLIAAVNGFLADVLIAWKENGWSLRRLMRTRRVVLTGAAVAIAFTIVASYGIVRISRARYLMGPRLAIVQPNVTRGPSNIVGPHLEQLLMTDRSVPPGEVDLIVWPENSILDNLFRPGAYLEDLRWQASRKDAWMLVGATGKPAAHPGKVTNTAFLLDNAGTVVERYDKQVLFPWTEYIPLDRFLGRLQSNASSHPAQHRSRGLGELVSGSRRGPNRFDAFAVEENVDSVCRVDLPGKQLRAHSGKSPKTRSPLFREHHQRGRRRRKHAGAATSHQHVARGREPGLLRAGREYGGVLFHRPLRSTAIAAEGRAWRDRLRQGRLDRSDPVVARRGYALRA